MQDRNIGYVLSNTRLSESRVILDTFTRDAGCIQGVLRFAKADSRAFLAPLTAISFQRVGRENQALKQVNEVVIENHCFDLVSNYTGLALASHWCWLLKQTQPHDHPEPRVFRLVEHLLASLKARTPTDEELHLTNLYFEIWLLHFIGHLGRHLPREDLTLDELDPETRLHAKLDRPLLSQVFQRKIEEYLPFALKLGPLNRSTTVLGNLWEHLLGRELKNRQLFYKQLKVRGAVT